MLYLGRTRNFWTHVLVGMSEAILCWVVTFFITGWVQVPWNLPQLLASVIWRQVERKMASKTISLIRRQSKKRGLLQRKGIFYHSSRISPPIIPMLSSVNDRRAMNCRTIWSTLNCSTTLSLGSILRFWPKASFLYTKLWYWSIHIQVSAASSLFWQTIRHSRIVY